MKPRFLIFFILVTIAYSNLNGRLIDLYKRGTIKLQNTSNFGAGVDWGLIFYDLDKNIVVSKDGEIFVSNASSNNIFKFDSNGKLLQTFGRPGLGPGDINAPTCYSIIDNKYLVISDFGLNRRISLFDLSGNFVNVIKTSSMSLYAVGLRNNCIAYNVYSSSRPHGNSLSVSLERAVIINTVTKREIQVESFSKQSNSIRLNNVSSVRSNSVDYFGYIAINSTSDGNLLVGISNSKIVKIISPEGKLLKTFTLNINPIPVTSEFVEEAKKETLDSIVNRKHVNPELQKMAQKAVEKTDYRMFFGDYLPYYSDIYVDSDGNILVFKFPPCQRKSNPVFQVYSPDGKYICETTLDIGMYDFEIDHRVKQISFTDKGIFAIVSYEKDDDTHIRLIKVKQ